MCRHTIMQVAVGIVFAIYPWHSAIPTKHLNSSHQWYSYCANMHNSLVMAVSFSFSMLMYALWNMTLRAGTMQPFAATE